MKFGMLVNTRDPPEGRNIAGLYECCARPKEAVGFDSVFVPEHHMMLDGYLPAPAVLLAAIAGRTRKIRLGTSILQLPEWDAIHVAEEWRCWTTSLTAARFWGLGSGWWNRSLGCSARTSGCRAAVERAGAGDPPVLVADPVLLFRQISSLRKGEHYAAPAAKPHPPIWIGAMSEPALKRAARLGDGWISDPLHHINVMKAWADIYRKEAAAHGSKTKRC